MALEGFAVIYTTGSGQVAAEVSLKNGLPDTTYNLVLAQTPSGAGCFTPPQTTVTLTTNDQGQGNAQISEPILAGQDDAFVLVTSTAGPGDFLASPDVIFG